jgi:hypothetical protein
MWRRKAKFHIIKRRRVRNEPFILHLKEPEWRWNLRLGNPYLLLPKNFARTRSNPGKTLNKIGPARFELATS